MSDLARALGISGGIVCAVGAGGKKTLCYALAAEAAGRTGLTTSVHTAPFPRRLDAHKLIDEEAALVERVPAERAITGITAYAQPAAKPKRLAGVTPAAIARIHEAGAFDLTLVKADGARMRSIKAPKPGEPVLVPGTSRVLVVVSAAVIGAPLDERIAHRPERLAELLGVEVGASITPEHVARLLVSREGGLQGTAGIAVTAVINQVDDEAHKDAAEAVARRVLLADTGIERVVLTCLQRPHPVLAIFSRDAL